MQTLRLAFSKRAARSGRAVARAAAAGLVIVIASAGAPARATAQQNARPSFTVATATAQRGQRAYGALKVPPGSDAGYDLPLRLR